MCQHANTMFTATTHMRDTHVECGAVQHKRIHPQAQLQARFTVVRTIQSIYIKHKRKKIGLTYTDVYQSLGRQ